MSGPDPIVIVAAARTALGRFQGEFAGVTAHALGAHVIGAALERASLSPQQVDEVLMGCVVLDGLEDAYEPGRPMGDFSEATAQAYQFTRQDQDEYAMETLTRARKAIAEGAFNAEIAPIAVPAKGREEIVDTDEHPLKVSPEKIPALKPAFRIKGTITAASASANADGAAALILARRSTAERENLPIVAEIKAHMAHSQEPAWYTTAPIPAIRKLLDKTGWKVADVDLFEINEAFAVVPMAQRRTSASCATG